MKISAKLMIHERGADIGYPLTIDTHADDYGDVLAQIDYYIDHHAQMLQYENFHIAARKPLSLIPEVLDGYKYFHFTDGWLLFRNKSGHNVRIFFDIVKADTDKPFKWRRPNNEAEAEN